MKLIRGHRSLSFPLDIDSCVATLGNFDGVHLGHQLLLRRLRELKQMYQLPAVVILFEPQPKEFFSKEPVVRLMCLREKYLALEREGVDAIICLRFNQALADLSAEAFVKQYLIDRCQVKALVVGEDFRFGKHRQGDHHLLEQLGRQYNFSVRCEPDVFYQGTKISSTRIRQSLQSSDLEKAHVLLGHPYSIRGKVVYGQGRGSRLGVPTANIHLHRSLTPLSGVFVTEMRGLDDSTYPSVASVGVRPTFHETQWMLEVHLFNFNRDIYGCFVEVVFLHRLREERYYNSEALLLTQMRQDMDAAKQYFKRLS